MKKKTNYREFFKYVKELNIGDYKQFLLDNTGGVTDSLSELAEGYYSIYLEVMTALRALYKAHVEQVAKSDKPSGVVAIRMDTWRKRVLAAIFGWGELSGKEFGMAEVKAIACRAGKAERFNDITEENLRAVFNEFSKKSEDLLAVRDADGQIAICPNENKN